MGAVISKATDEIGDLLEKTLLAPFQTMFDGSCQECSEPWDMVCFIEHLCVTNLLKLLMIMFLCYISNFLFLTFVFLFTSIITVLLFSIQVGDPPMHWKKPLYKLSNTKRVNRRRRRHLRHYQFRDIEEGYSSSGDNDLWDDYHNLNVSRKRKSLSRRRRDRVQRSAHPSSQHGSQSHHHRHVRLKTRSMSVRVMGRSQRLKSSRRVKIGKVKNVRRKTKTFKRRRLR
uniref:uncharacterized protein LOC105350906 n=1 Tax=Fragaria vesca subsp. vesca TaxID=101020 RepID=UPI0005CA0D31|nr:PREDICTED: uncharacterized protein LOC105350906 [Fragaria vesca subsp. vesca]